MSQKKSKKKVLITVLVVILVLFGVLITAGLLMIDPVAKTAINTVAPLITGVETSVEDIHIALFKGRVEVRNFVMGNPEGFSSPNAIQMGEVVVALNLKDTGAEKIIIDEISLKDVNVNFETNILNSNLQTILSGMEKKEKEEKEVEKSTAPEAKEKSAAKLQINEIELDDVGFSIYAKGAKTGVPIHVSMKPIGPLGEGPDGITPVSASVKVLTAIVTTAVEKAGGSVTEAGKQIGNAAKDAAAGLGATAAEGLKNLFGGSGKSEK